MGGIFSLPRRKKSSKDTLEGLHNTLQKLKQNQAESQQCEQTFIGTLLFLVILLIPFLSLMGVVGWVWLHHLLTTELIITYILIFILLPLLLYGFKKLINVWFSHRKTQYNLAIQSTEQQKKHILEEVMEKEPYKVARELLEKYDPSNPQLRQTTPVSQQSKDTLEGLHNTLQKLKLNQAESQQCERTFIGALLFLVILLIPFLSLMGVVGWVWLHHLLTTELIITYILIFILLLLLLYGFKKLINFWFSHRKTQYNLAIQSTEQEKKHILEEVMEKEPYKVARELLEKYDSSNPQLRPTTPVSQQGNVRQRRPQPQTPHPSLQHHPIQNTSLHTPLNTPSRPSPQHTPSPLPQIITTPVPPTRGGDGNTNAQINPHSQTTPFIPPGYCLGPGPGPPNPVIDYMLGDGPANRFALICSECHSHNGMALKDQYEYLNYRCAYCYHLNPARKTRPIQQPIINTTTPTDMNTRTTNNNDKEQDQDKPEEENDTKETKP